MNEEPSVLDWVKAKLTPWRGPAPQIPPAPPQVVQKPTLSTDIHLPATAEAPSSASAPPDLFPVAAKQDFQAVEQEYPPQTLYLQ